MTRRSTARPLRDRFSEKVSVQQNGCWLWTGASSPLGYGKVWSGGGKGRCVFAHRVAWELEHGPIPAGLLVCHRCDVPSCVNPAHLFLGTDADNAADKIAKGRLRHGNGRPPRQAGMAHPMAKLTDEGVRAIRIRLAKGERQTSIARDLGISASTVNLISRNRIWKEVA